MFFFFFCVLAGPCKIILSKVMRTCLKRGFGCSSRMIEYPVGFTGGETIEIITVGYSSSMG